MKTRYEIIEEVLSKHPCYIKDGVKMYSYLECKRMLDEAVQEALKQ